MDLDVTAAAPAEHLNDFIKAVISKLLSGVDHRSLEGKGERWWQWRFDCGTLAWPSFMINSRRWMASTSPFSSIILILILVLFSRSPFGDFFLFR
ncbi:hypothetical protein TYRP_011900 [Tyrophagus putrescentiae]|nr:hypothetical protein TYRP_011900 [Tyrophagus putrescentiae]